MKHLFIAITLFTLNFVQSQTMTFQDKFENQISVLNFGTFHMGYTNDANSFNFDENDANNKKEVWKIAKLLSEFKPTVILVEMPPTKNVVLQKMYADYLLNPKMKIENPNEIHLLAFELGRLSDTKRIYGIDSKLGYNYAIANEIADNKVNDSSYEKYMEMVTKQEALVNFEKMPLLEQLKLNNSPQYLDFLMNVNADMLTYASTENKSEGADEAGKFYLRNLRIFSNLNQIKLEKEDRVFIIMGAAHTAFLNEFMKRSPKYELVDPFLYLN
jgi:hypothetical protein